MQTRSQQYSQAVFQQISDLQLTEKENKTYGSLCHNFPLMVLRSGLSQAVAFVLVKAKLTEPENKQSKPHRNFLEHLSKLTRNSQPAEVPAEFQQRINRAELTEYQRLTRKILTASIWYKRFAESLLDVRPGDEAGDSHDD